MIKNIIRKNYITNAMELQKVEKLQKTTELPNVMKNANAMELQNKMELPNEMELQNKTEDPKVIKYPNENANDNEIKIKLIKYSNENELINCQNTNNNIKDLVIKINKKFDKGFPSYKDCFFKDLEDIILFINISIQEVENNPNCCIQENTCPYSITNALNYLLQNNLGNLENFLKNIFEKLSQEYQEKFYEYLKAYIKN